MSAPLRHALRHHAAGQDRAGRRARRARRPQPLLLGAGGARRRGRRGGPALRPQLTRRARRGARRPRRDGRAQRAGAGRALAAAVPAPSGGSAGQVTASGSDYATSVRVELTLTPGRRRPQRLRALGGRLRHRRPARDRHRREHEVLAAGAPVGRAPSRWSWPRLPTAAGPASGLDFSVAGRWQVDVAIQEEAKGSVVPLELTSRRRPLPEAAGAPASRAAPGRRPFRPAPPRAGSPRPARARVVTQGREHEAFRDGGPDHRA